MTKEEAASAMEALKEVNNMTTFEYGMFRGLELCGVEDMDDDQLEMVERLKENYLD